MSISFGLPHAMEYPHLRGKEGLSRVKGDADVLMLYTYTEE